MTFCRPRTLGFFLASCLFALGASGAFAAQPKAPDPLCVDNNCVGQQQPVSGSAIKWHPGHYLWITGSSYSSTFLSSFKTQVDSICSNDKIKGVQVTISWASLEGAKGDYSSGFSYTDQLLAKLKSCNKYLMMSFKFSDFGPAFTSIPTSGSWIMPQYITSNSAYGGSAPPYGVAYSAPGVSWAGSLRMIARMWEQPVMDRVIALKEAYGRRYNGDPAFEMISAGETAVGATSETGFTYPAYITQLKRVMVATSRAWPNTQVRLPANYTGTSAQMLELFNLCRSLGNCNVGGPDPELPLPDISRSIQANRLFRGLDGGADLRGTVPWVGEQQDLGVLSTVKMCCEAIAEVAEYQKTVMRNSYQIWVKRDETLPSLLKYLAADGSVYLTSCPSSFAGCKRD